MNGNSSPAIEVNGNSNLFINGTGSLYAIGTVGIGNPNGVVGNIEITGGTVVASGTAGIGIGGSEDNGTDVYIHGNTFVVSNGTGNVIENFESGIFYDSSDGDYIADVKGDVTLDSSYPSADEILGSELKFDILDQSSLTLGSGISFPTTRLANTNDEDKLKAYKVTYDLNNNIKLGTTAYTINVNGAAPASIYAGPNVSLAAELPTATNIEQTWQAMAWGRENNGSYQEVTTTPASPSPITVAANNNEFGAKTIWAVEKWTTVEVTEYGIMDKGIQLFYPQEAASLYTLTGGDALNQYGAMLGTEGTEKNQVVPSGSVTAKASDTPAEVTLTISGENKTITIPFKVNKDVRRLEDATLIPKNVVYDGAVIEKTEVVESVKFKDAISSLDERMYTVKFAADNEGKVGTELSSAPKDAGFYWVKAVADPDEVTNLIGETEYVPFEIKKATATVTAEDVEWTIGTAGPTFTGKLKAEGVEADKGKLTVDFTDPTGPWTTAGVYKVTYTDIKLNDDLAGNYNEVAAVEGTLTVKKNGDENDPINPGDPTDPDTEIKIDDGEGGWEWSENGYTRVYDGEKHSLKADNLVYVRQKGGENEWVAVPASAITVTSVSPEGDIKNQGTYTVKLSIAEAKDILYSGTVGDITLVITPRPMIVTIDPLTAEDLEKETVSTDMVTFEEEGDDRGLVTDEPAGVSGKMKVTENTASSVEGEKSYTVEFSELKLMDSGDKTSFLADNYTPTFKYGDTELKDGAGTIPDVTIDEITPGEDTDIDDGNDDEDNNWTWDAEANAYILIYDGNKHGIESITVSGAEATEIKVTYSNKEGELGEGVLPLNAGHYTAEVVVTVDETSKTGTFPLWIKHRPLGVHFNLDDYILEAGGEYDADGKAEYEPVDGIGGVLADEKPVLEGTIKVADTPNSEGKYAVTFDGVKLGTEGNFDANNYEPTYYLNGELIELDGNGDGTFGDDDPEQGIDISEPDDETGISGIGTKRYRLYLANKDYNVVDAKADYAAEGLELFSRHDQKYTKAGGSVTVWYEKDGVANAGGYRIFWSNRANGEYKEVKFDTVSEYFQIRNVQSDVYVKIYAADGFPVGNEEISAADYRAYAQPNKIVVITPQPTDVQIISMAGAVVATDKVTGQREFANLTEGVYIVRMGETVVKLQVRK